MFALGWLLPALLAVCMVLMGGMLLVYRVLVNRRRQDVMDTTGGRVSRAKLEYRGRGLRV